jgi:CDP-glucose 4,6-dehydratase
MQGKPEAQLLKLSCDRALAELRWRAVLTFSECVRLTAEWYRAYQTSPADAARCTPAQIQAYIELARTRGMAWAAA